MRMLRALCAALIASGIPTLSKEFYQREKQAKRKTRAFRRPDFVGMNRPFYWSKPSERSRAKRNAKRGKINGARRTF